MIYTFFIKDLYDTTAIVEPKGWKDLMSELDRPFETHGVFFSYAGGGDKEGTVFKLGFSCEAKTLLEAAYQLDGTEAFYQFGVNEAANEYVTPTEIFLGDIDFNTRKYDEEDYFNAEINQITNLVKLKNRATLKTNFNKQLTHDGIVVSKLNAQTISLLSDKVDAKTTAINNGEVQSQQSLAVATDTQIYMRMGFDETESTELETYSKTASEWIADVDSVNPKLTLVPFLTLAKQTALEFEVYYDFDIDFVEDQGGGTTDYSYNLAIVADNINLTNDIPSYNVTGNNSSAASPFNYSDTQYGFSNKVGPSQFYAGTWPEGTNFFIRFAMFMTSAGTAQFTPTITIREIKVIFRDLSANVSTDALCYHPFDALNKTLNFINGSYDYLYSELLGDINRGYASNGCFSTMRLTNGYRVRQINADGKAPTESFKGFIDNLNAPGAIGYGIESLESPTELADSGGESRFEIEWNGLQGIWYDINILDVNLEADISVGDMIGFFNSDSIYGTYEVMSVNFNIFPTRTDVELLPGDIGVKIPEGTISSGIVIMTNSVTEFKDKLRVEKWEHFYGDTELIDLGTVQDYSEEPFDDILINEFNLGFKKYANDEDKPTTLEDFETRSSWGLPLTKSDNKLSKIMSWIMSTFLINESRATLFTEKPTTSHKLDNNLFLFDVNDARLSTTATFVHNASSLDTIEVDANTYENYIRDTSVFAIEDATIIGNNQGYLYDWTLVLHKLPEDTYLIYLDSAIVTSDADDPCTVIGYAFDGVQFVEAVKAESTENLISSYGLSVPDYTYNQRRTMKRFLIRWGRYLNSVMGYISDSVQTIQNLVYINNGDLTTELDSYALDTDCLMGDSSYASVIEDENINTNSFPSAKFKPNFIYCTVKICDTDYTEILNAHKNRLQSPDDVKNYGYFSATSPKGKSVSGWLMNMKRSPVDRIAKLKLLERA